MTGTSGCPHHRGDGGGPAPARAGLRVHADAKTPQPLAARRDRARRRTGRPGRPDPSTRRRQSLLRSRREGSDQLIVLSTGAHPRPPVTQRREPLPHRAGDRPPHLEHFAKVTGSIGAPDGSTGELGKPRRLAERTGSAEGSRSRSRSATPTTSLSTTRCRQLHDAALLRQRGGAGGDERGRCGPPARRGTAGPRSKQRGSASTSNAADAHGRLRWMAAVVAARGTAGGRAGSDRAAAADQGVPMTGLALRCSRLRRAGVASVLIAVLGRRAPRRHPRSTRSTASTSCLSQPIRPPLRSSHRPPSPRRKRPARTEARRPTRRAQELRAGPDPSSGRDACRHLHAGDRGHEVDLRVGVDREHAGLRVPRRQQRRDRGLRGGPRPRDRRADLRRHPATTSWTRCRSSPTTRWRS